MRKKDINSIKNPNFKNGKYVKVDKICINCGKEYIGYQSSICCSRSCGSKYSKQRYTKCEICGENIQYWKHQRFCSYLCSAKYKSLNAKKNNCKTCNKEISSWMSYCNTDCFSKSISLRDEKSKSKQRNMMLNGGAAYASSFITNPSKPQVELFELTKKLINNVILNFPVTEVNRCIDIAIPDRNIAIEYDGSYWHQDEEKDMIRQEELEKLGWRFIRFRDRIPSLMELTYKIIGEEVKC